MAEEQDNTESIQPEFPRSRVKKIMTVDKDVQRVSSEALFLVSCATELFLQSLAEKSARVAIEKKRKTVKLDHIRVAVKRHRPTSDFLLDLLPVVSETAKSDKPEPAVDRVKSNPIGTRRIDQIFKSKQVAQVEPEPEPEPEEPVPMDEAPVSMDEAHVPVDEAPVPMDEAHVLVDES